MLYLFLDHSAPDSSIHGISQARILEWVPFSSPGDLPDPGIKNYAFIYFWLSWFSSYMQAFSSCGEQGLLFTTAHGRLIVMASRALGSQASVVAAHGLGSSVLRLSSTGSVVTHGLSNSTVCGIFPDQGSNPCPRHWQADTYPRRHQSSAITYLF